ncbi:MAG: histidine phosphatase family protein [Ruminococcaceae bacterium]|nr:histidine phosphatase family protein [Oscillospiraceae bacterium]
MENLKNEDVLEIIFIRHAETNYTDIGDRDNCDGELTEFGEKQCCILGEKLKNVEIDGFITSSLLRAFKTATGVCKAKKNSPVLYICPELIECGCTPGYFGCSEKYLQKYYKNTKMCKKLFGTKEYEFGCEAVEDNNRRAQKVIEYIKEKYTYGNRVAVFSHHGMLEYLIPTALGLETRKFFFSLDNISMTVVQYTRDGACILKDVNK